MQPEMKSQAELNEHKSKDISKNLSLEGIDKVRDILFGKELRDLQLKLATIEKVQTDHTNQLSNIETKLSEIDMDKLNLKHLSDLFLEFSQKILIQKKK